MATGNPLGPVLTALNTEEDDLGQVMFDWMSSDW